MPVEIPLPISKGGTSSSTSENARLNLNAAPINNPNFIGNITTTGNISGNIIYSSSISSNNLFINNENIFDLNNSVFTTVSSNSASWGLSSPQSLSFNETNDQLSIQNANTVSLSSIFEKTKNLFTPSNFLPVSGGTINGDLLVLSSIFITNNPNNNISNEKLTVVGNISATGAIHASNNLPYRSGDTITEIIFQTDALAAGGATTTTTSLGERAFGLVDIGNVSKWTKSGCSGPILDFFIIGRVTNSNSFSEYDLVSNNLRIPNSYLTTSSTTNVILSSRLEQTDFPSNLSIISVRSGLNGTIGSCSISNATLKATWTVL
jgi:hypothetical protein